MNPETPELKYAGDYAPNEWRKLARENPELAQALIELRQAQKDKERSEDRLATGIGVAGGGLASYALRNQIGAGIDRLTEIPGVAETLAPVKARVESFATQQALNHLGRSIPVMGDVDPFYSGDRVEGIVHPGGIVSLSVDGQTASRGPSFSDLRQIAPELKQAEQAWADYTAAPGNQKLFVAYPEDIDGNQAKRISRLEKAGFKARPSFGGGPAETLVFDNRPNARILGGLYNLADNTAFAVLNKPRFAGHLKTAGKTAGVVGAGVLGAIALSKGIDLLNGD
jgi:hypothetical protein